MELIKFFSILLGAIATIVTISYKAINAVKDSRIAIGDSKARENSVGKAAINSVNERLDNVSERLDNAMRERQAMKEDQREMKDEFREFKEEIRQSNKAIMKHELEAINDSLRTIGKLNRKDNG